MKVGILTGGGDCPGLNAVIRAAVRKGIFHYNDEFVGFIEGWFVYEASRQQGIGRALMRSAEEWARKQGCLEIASDTWIDHEDSQRAHQALGFEVVDRCVHFRKTL